VRLLTSKLARDDRGTTTIEFTIVALLFFLVTFGLVEFGYLFWQYNSASKAVQVGARLAAVSDPVWTGLTSLTDDEGTVGGAWSPGFTYNVVCDGGATPPECGGSAAEYDETAMQRLVDGRDNVCGQVGADGNPGMCDIFGRITTKNVVVTYSHTGLGFVGRPGGPVPTITVQLTGLTFEFVALGDLLGLDPITMPDFMVTMTGEDLNALAP
jgi:TadE-like protein